MSTVTEDLERRIRCNEAQLAKVTHPVVRSLISLELEGLLERLNAVCEIEAEQRAHLADSLDWDSDCGGRRCGLRHCGDCWADETLKDRS